MNIIPTPLYKADASASLSKADAQYLQNKLQPNEMVGQGWGRRVVTMNKLTFINHQNAAGDFLGQFTIKMVKLLICHTIKG
ncbi:hypothetical protein [Gottfriedia acidiceleris]|uniref:hypothetical protein n=1 Tax=Gottfriedia acidiceleris TaxID=371036 RepID=UPI002FFE9866